MRRDKYVIDMNDKSTPYPPQARVEVLCEKMAINATPVRHSAIPVRRSPRLLAQRHTPGSSLLVGLLNRDTETRDARIAAAAGSKRSYHESGQSAPSKRPRTQPLDSRFIDSLMLSLTGEHAFSELNISRCSSEAQELLMVTTCKLEYHEPAGYLSRLRMIIDNNQGYKIQVSVNFVSQCAHSNLLLPSFNLGTF